jgi:hypothetical protein
MSLAFHQRSALDRSKSLIIELEAARHRLLKTQSASPERSALEQLIAHLHRELNQHGSTTPEFVGNRS